jgi:hypothetical protein
MNCKACGRPFVQEMTRDGMCGSCYGIMQQRVASNEPTRKPSLLTFISLPVKTETVHLEIHLKRNDAVLGHILWELPWRQYVFIPLPGARYTRSVLKAVNVKLARLMRSWAQAHPSAKRGKPINAIDYRREAV